MSQADLNVANQSGAAFRADLNTQLLALGTLQSGASEPGTTYAYMLWADSANGLLKQRNAANNGWVSLGSLVTTNLGMLPIAGGTMTGALGVTAGTVSAPGVFFSGDTNTGLYSPGADTLALATAGTNKLHITSAGLVGIGNNSPSYLLDVSGSAAIGIRYKSTGNYGGIILDNTSATGGGYFAAYQNGTQKAIFGLSGAVEGNTTSDCALFGDTGSNIRFYTNASATEKMRLDTSGRLLVGTSSSLGNFFNNASSIDHCIQGESTTPWSQSWVTHGGTNAASGSYLTVGRSRGTTAGSVTVVASGDLLGSLNFQGADGSEFVEAANIKAEVDGTPGANDMPGRLVFSTTADGASSPTERMRITATGLVSIKSDSGYANGIKYDNGATSSLQHYDRITFGAASYYILNNSLVGVRLDNGATSWSAQSDERLKTNLTEISDGLGKIGTLRAVTGRYLNDETTVSRSFLIAQDVRDVLPEAVSEDNDDSGTLNLRYTEVIPLLVAALKESKERIEQLETEMAAVKAQLA